ncbi:hypothetical protein B566_EDAN018146 [Ephemera danica]|nr:hypothetical protein B566_EDAN018146 [Ephemera danica]
MIRDKNDLYNVFARACMQLQDQAPEITAICVTNHIVYERTCIGTLNLVRLVFISLFKCTIDLYRLNCNVSSSSIAGFGNNRTSNDGRHYCYLCSRSYSFKGDLSKHLKLVHTNNDFSVACELCSRVCPNKSSLAAHIRKTHSGKHECCHCHKLLASKEYLNLHIRKFCPILSGKRSYNHLLH